MVDRPDLFRAEKIAASFQVSYDGNKDIHEMDVQLLGPALVGFGDIIRQANLLLNSDKATVQLVVKTDFEHKCFNINFELIQTLYDQVKILIQKDDVKTAKEILEWLGLLGAPSIVGLLGYLKWRRGRKVQKVSKIHSEDKHGEIRIDVAEGATVDSIVINQIVYDLSRDTKVLDAVSTTVTPIEPGQPFDKLELKKNDEVISTVTREDAEQIEKTCNDTEGLDAEILSTQDVTAYLRILGPVFDPTAHQWRFFFGDQQIRADISQTDIAAQAIERGGVAVGDSYKVNMKITQYRTPTGQFRNRYDIDKVIEFHPSSRQMKLI